MKYPAQKTVSAKYNESDGSDHNPFLEAMPPMLTKTELFNQIQSFPLITVHPFMNGNERRQLLPLLQNWYLPIDYMYMIYDEVYRAIKSTYLTMNAKECVQQLNALQFENIKAITKQDYTTNSVCSALLGVPGIGKTSVLRKCVQTMPQVIEHSQYCGKAFYCKQINYIFVECPSDCSIKALTFNIAMAIDNAIGSSYADYYNKLKILSSSALVLSIKQLCINHHIGILIVDEIQNVVQTASRNRQVGKLIKFLVELTNDTCTSIYLVGTLEAETLFLKEEHLKRRTRGYRLLPMEYGRLYRYFIDNLWNYQVVKNKTHITDSLAALIYDLTGGVPAYITKIFQETQAYAITSGYETIDENSIKQTAKMLSIYIPQKYNVGCSISSFSVIDDYSNQTGSDGSVIVNKRGRRANPRDDKDILKLAENCDDVQELKTKLQQAGMLDDIKIC